MSLRGTEHASAASRSGEAALGLGREGKRAIHRGSKKLNPSFPAFLLLYSAMSASLMQRL